MRHWNRLSRGSVDVPALEVFKARLDGALSNLVKGIPAHSRGLELGGLLRSIPTQIIL